MSIFSELSDERLVEILTDCEDQYEHCCVSEKSSLWALHIKVQEVIFGCDEDVIVGFTVDECRREASRRWLDGYKKVL